MLPVTGGIRIKAIGTPEVAQAGSWFDHDGQLWQYNSLLYAGILICNPVNIENALSVNR